MKLQGGQKTTEQYLGLSQLVYNNLEHWNDVSNKPSLSTILDNLGDKDRVEYNALNTISQEWQFIRYDDAGFAGAAFQNPTTDELVFAFRGTEFFTNGLLNGLKDVKQDVQIATGGQSHTPNQFDNAYDFWLNTLSQVGGSSGCSSYSFTGHSLGGGIAQYMTYVTADMGSDDVGVRSLLHSTYAIRYI